MNKIRNLIKGLALIIGIIIYNFTDKVNFKYITLLLLSFIIIIFAVIELREKKKQKHGIKLLIL